MVKLWDSKSQLPGSNPGALASMTKADKLKYIEWCLWLGLVLVLPGDVLVAADNPSKIPGRLLWYLAPGLALYAIRKEPSKNASSL